MLVRKCARLGNGEAALILSNPATRAVGQYVAEAAAELTAHVRHTTIDALAVHGTEPAPGSGRGDGRGRRGLLPHDVLAGAHGGPAAGDRAGRRFLSLPDYSLALLGSESLQVDFDALVPQAEALAARLDAGRAITLHSPLGTRLTLDISGRQANCCPGVCRTPGSLGSPPDAEVNVAPLEHSAHGVAWIDGSVPCPGIGRLAEPIRLDIDGGRVVRFSGPPAVVARLEAVFAELPTPHTRVLAEFGIGLNPRAHLTGRMLEDEGCAGTIHLGFGSNATIGGTNRVAFHLDFVMIGPDVSLDGAGLLEQGSVCS